MIARVTRSRTARAAAALLALALSGAVRAVPAVPIGPHRCECRAHGLDHECGCAICNAQARREPGNLPPCHRDAARRALARRDEEHARRARLPGVLPSCGVPPGDVAPPPAAESFTLPRAPSPACFGAATAASLPAAFAPERAERPELPPPRVRPAVTG